MAFAPSALVNGSEARHSPEWYGGAFRESPLQRGDRILIRCDGGPCLSRLETFPPRLEIQERTGMYVLVDDGPLEAWSYRFVHAFVHEASS